MMNSRLPFSILLSLAICSLVAVPGSPQKGTLGELANGTKVVSVQAPSGELGIEVQGPGLASLKLLQPARVEFYEAEDKISELAAGYKSLKKSGEGFVGQAELKPSKGLSFAVEDHWKISGSELSLARKVVVAGTSAGGFLSGIFFSTPPSLRLPDTSYFIPGSSYGGPLNLLENATAGMANFQSGQIDVREDILPIPIVGMHFKDGTSLAILDTHPRGDTTVAEWQAGEEMTKVDSRYLFGAMGVREKSEGGVEIGFWLPGSVSRMQPASGRRRPPVRRWRRRYHPIREGFSQQYELAFRLGRDESFHGFYTNAWRWAWAALKPPVDYHDIELVRRSIVDRLGSAVIKSGDRTGIPFQYESLTAKLGPNFFDSNVVMGFTGKNLESAGWLLAEADRDPSPRGEKLRQSGLAIIDSFVRLVKLTPPEGEGFNIFTGEQVPLLPADFGPVIGNKIYLRCLTEDLKMLLKAYRRELNHGRDHPEWLHWAWQFGDWVRRQQHPDGGFPRTWKPGTGEVQDDVATSTYAPIAFLVLLSQETGNPQYMDSALRAGEFCWLNYGSNDQFVGGTPDNPNVMDKEAGTLSMEAYLALYEATKDTKWLARSAAAADYAETWIYGWNVPMPADDDDSKLHWKKGVSTVGVNKINSTTDGVDQWMAVDVHEYAKLYAYTHDAHYLEIARILLHNTKNMVALPGRTYGMAGPGIQQEHWSLSIRRGYGWHTLWLPWISANHLTGIYSLEEFDPELFKKLASKE